MTCLNPACFVLAVLLAAGCSIQPAARVVSPLDPMRIHAAAATLKGKPTESLVVIGGEAPAEVPLTTAIVRNLAERCGQSVVSIFVKTSTPHQVRLLRFLPAFTVDIPGEGLGSGFFIHPSVYVLTNEHVIRGASQIHAMTRGGESLELIVVAEDPVYDLALLKTTVTGRKFDALPMGNSEAAGVGEPVIAVGNPLGLGHIGTLEAEAADGNVDQAGVEGAQQRLVQPQPLHHAGAEVLDEDIGIARQAFCDRDPFWRLEVEDDGALVAVVVEK